MHDLNDMLFFAEVVNQGGFSAASRSLDIPKSKLSRRLSELEARLGARLLQRSTRTMSLTPAGEAYYQHCASLREQARAADEAVARLSAEPRGTVRMCCPVNLAQSVMATILPRFLAAHPLVRIDLRVSNRPIDLIQEGIDIALRVRASFDDSGSLVVKRLGVTPNLLLASAGFVARHGMPEQVAALQRLPTVAMSTVEGRTTWQLAGADGKIVDVVHRPVFTADDLVVLKQAVLEGAGVSILPAFMCGEALREGALVVLLAPWSPPATSVVAVYPSSRGVVPAVRKLLDFLGSSFAKAFPQGQLQVPAQPGTVPESVATLSG